MAGQRLGGCAGRALPALLLLLLRPPATPGRESAPPAGDGKGAEGRARRRS